MLFGQKRQAEAKTTTSKNVKNSKKENSLMLNGRPHLFSLPLLRTFLQIK